ncbi:MAG: hypothetical protein ABI554_06060 [Flavobacterium sp.]
MKKIKLLNYLTALLVMLILGGCSKDDTQSNTGSMPTADFSFTNDDNLFSFTNLSDGATTYRWDFGDLGFYCDKENPMFRYTKIGGEIQVTLTAISETGEESSITKTITAPVVYNITIAIDGSFADWKNVPVLHDESSLQGGSIKKIKMWGKGDNINVYFEGNTAMKMEIVDLFINTDGNAAIGWQSWQWPKGSGADYLFEGPLVSNGWGDFYKHTDPAGGWGWNQLVGTGVNLKSSGVVSINSTTNAVEFSIPKAKLGTLGSSISLAISEMTSGWSAVASFPKPTDISSFATYTLPIEAVSLCQ